MPVTTRQRGGKWRVIEAASGRICKNKAGTPVDGGGFDSKEHAARQCRAINRSLSKRGKI